MPLDRAGVGDASEVTGVKTRKTSADVFKSAIQRKVSTFSALHAWKRTSTGNDNVAKESTTTETELKSLSKEENGRAAKPPRITLSVHKMTPIPSVELDDYTPEQTAVTNGEKPEELVDAVLQKNLSWPEMLNANQGRGILKKNSVVEWPAEMVEEHPVEGESGAEMTNNNPSSTVAAAVGEVEPKKEILLGRTVKFDMPSFDSQTSDEIPEIIVEVVTEMSKAESSPKVLVSEEQKYVEPEDSSKEDVCDESFEIDCTDMSETMKEVIKLMKEIEEDVKRTSEEEEKEDKEVEQLKQQRKRLKRELAVILKAIVRNNYALMKQGVDLQVEALRGEEDKEGEEANEEEEEEEETGVSEIGEEGVRHTLVLPRSQILQCTSCWPAAAEREISEDTKVPKRCHSCPSLTTRCPSSWTEEKEEAAFAQTFLCRYREDEDFEDEGLGLGIALQLPLLPATAILGSDWQEREPTNTLPSQPGNIGLCAESMESIAWDIEGMGRALRDARETHMV